MYVEWVYVSMGVCGMGVCEYGCMWNGCMRHLLAGELAEDGGEVVGIVTQTRLDGLLH